MPTPYDYKAIRDGARLGWKECPKIEVFFASVEPFTGDTRHIEADAAR